jgi:hypothetical protein
VDQAKTFPSVLQELLNSGTGSAKYEVLNASAPGWAPENEIGFVRTFGTFNSHILLLEVGTNDLLLPAALPIASNMPEKRPFCALHAIILKFMCKPGSKPEAAASKDGDWKQFEANVLAWREIFDIAHGNGCRVAVLYVKHQGNKDAALIERAERSLLGLLEDCGVPYASAAKRFQDFGPDRLFRDGIHPNETGHKVLAECAYELISKLEG